MGNAPLGDKLRHEMTCCVNQLLRRRGDDPLDPCCCVEWKSELGKGTLNGPNSIP